MELNLTSDAQGGLMTDDLSNRKNARSSTSCSLKYQPGPKGSTVDTDRIRSILLEDPELALCRHLGLLAVVAMEYEKTYRDDSLAVLLKNSALEANIPTPKILSFTPRESPNKSQVVELQMAEGDVRAGDAHRILTQMRIEGMSTELRQWSARETAKPSSCPS